MLDRRRFLLTQAAFLAVSELRGAAPPKQFLLIRHGEKGIGKNNPDLDPRGLERAAALPRLFPERFEVPAFLFATAPSARSNRPVETLTPLSRALRLTINARYPDGAVAPLAKEILSNPRYSNATILICWHHETLPALARELKALDRPARWPDKQYDRVWKIEYAEEKVIFSNLPQHLLSGDSD